MIVTVTLNPSLDEWVTLSNLKVGDLNRVERFRRYPGGKGINVSRVAHEINSKTVAVALAGGEDGKILEHLLVREGINHLFVTVKGSTRNNYQIYDNKKHSLTQINCPGPRVTPRNIGRLKSLLNRIIKRSRCIVFSGSLPPGASASTYQMLIASLRQSGVPIVLDASGEPLAKGMLARPWLAKPNKSELEEFVGRPLRGVAEILSAGKSLVESGPSVLIVSLGKDGAILVSGKTKRALLAITPQIPVASAVGAGDSLVAGFITGYLRSHSMEEALRLGVACGTATAMTPGTELCRLSDVRKLVPRIRIKAL